MYITVHLDDSTERAFLVKEHSFMVYTDAAPYRYSGISVSSEYRFEATLEERPEFLGNRSQLAEISRELDRARKELSDIKTENLKLNNKVKELEKNLEDGEKHYFKSQKHEKNNNRFNNLEMEK